MKQTSILKWLVLVIFPLLVVACNKDENNEPDILTGDVAKNIVGRWLLSTSDKDNWISYEFTETSRINTEIVRGGISETGFGYYSVENENISGGYNTERDDSFYIDWKVKGIHPFEINIDIYDENVYVGNASIYRIVSDIAVDIESPKSIDFKGICGTDNVSEINVLDPTIAEVDPENGDVRGVEEGTTFMTFSTPNGKACVKITVEDSNKTFAEQIVGSWVYDSPADKTWERYTYEAGGFISAQWETYDGVYNLSESGQSTYTIDGTTVSFSFKVDVGQLNMRFETVSINDFDWTYNVYDKSHFNGKYTAQRILESNTLSPKETKLPDYQHLVGNATVQGFKSHNETVAKVNGEGLITGISKGRTYIDVKTNKGTGVIEVIVGGGAIPVAFEECIGETSQKVHEIIGDNPYYEDETTILYKNYSSDIEKIGISFDTWTNLVKGVVVTYKSSVDPTEVTTILNATFVPFMNQTTDSFKAYMDTVERSEAKVGVTWDITKRTLTYVNLETDLFRDYSVLIGLSEQEVLSKMGKEPDVKKDYSLNFFFYNGEGIAIVSAYFTDFEKNYDNVQMVATMLDETLSEENVMKYLKKKYLYYPEQSSETEYSFVTKDKRMAVFYQPADRWVTYIPLTSVTKSLSKRSLAEKIKKTIKTIRR